MQDSEADGHRVKFVTERTQSADAGNCAKKAVYDSRNKAAKGAQVPNSKGRKMRPYKCWTCKKWHLTTQSRQQQRHIRESMGGRP